MVLSWNIQSYPMWDTILLRAHIFNTICYEIVSGVYVLFLLAAWSLSVLFQNNSPFVVLKDNVLKNIMSLSIQPISSSYYGRHTIFHWYKFSFSGASSVQIFIFVELTMGNIIPVDRPPPVCPLMFGCTTNSPLIHHFSNTFPLAIRISGRFLVLLVYLVRWTNLVQSSLSGSLTLKVRN